MSGGHFDYNQFKIKQMSEDIESLILNNNNHSKNEFGDTEGTFFKKETIDEFKKAVKLLNVCYEYVQRIDWLVSGDDGEETFHERLQENLDKNEKNEKYE
jgi:hypothetical protein